MSTSQNSGNEVAAAGNLTGATLASGVVNSSLTSVGTLTGLTVAGQYYSSEYNNGSVSGTATVNWNNGNVQYLTMTANTTLTFSNPQAGARYLLHVAGAFTPTFPGTVRWPASTTPTATATSGKKDIYAFVYCGVESLYDGSALQKYRNLIG